MYNEIIINLEKQLSPKNLEEIKNKYGSELYVNDEFWERKKDSKYASLIIIDKLIKLNPFGINKKGMQTWIAL